MLNIPQRTNFGNMFTWSFWSLAVPVHPEESKLKARGVAGDHQGVPSISHDPSPRKSTG